MVAGPGGNTTVQVGHEAVVVVDTQTMSTPEEGQGNGNVKLVELRGIERIDISLPALFARVVELQHGACRFDAVVDLWSRNDEAVASKSFDPAQGRFRQLKDV